MTEPAKDEAELIQWMARGICCGNLSCENKDCHIDPICNAHAALGGIRAAGWAVVPVAEQDALCAENARLREALKGLLDYSERYTCKHEETHRGGFLWEICDVCGDKWADDMGGKTQWKDPPEWVAARAALAGEVKS